MDQWKYRTVTCEREELKDEKGKKYKDWVVTFTDGNQIVGMDKILANEGQHGWELVSVVAEISTGDPYITSVSRYRFFFKKRVE